MVHDALILPRWHPLARLALFAVLYAGLSWMGTKLIIASDHASSVWLPSGLVLFALLMTPTRHWPAVLLTVIATGSLVHASLPKLLNFLIPACGALEGLVGAALLRRFVGPRVDLHRVKDVVGLVTLSAGFSTALASFLAVTLMVLVGMGSWQHYWHSWRVFWIGDAMGVMVVTPLLLTWPHSLKNWGRRRRWKLGALLLVVGLATHAVFHGEPSEPWTFHPLVYLAFPLIFWAALRFEAAGAISATLILSTVALWHTAHGTGPFATTDSQESPLLASSPAGPLTHRGLSAPMKPTSSQGLFLLQSFLGAVNICGLLLAAALGERRRAQLEVSVLNWELHQSLERLARAQSELVARERMAALGELSATLAHEVRNPLGAIANCVSALRRLPERQPDAQRQPLLDILSEEVLRLDQLVHELLDFARPVHPQPRPEPLEAVVEGALSAVLRSQASHCRVTVRREVEPDLPLALVDVRLLHMALSNLFTNALQAMPEGGALHVRIAREAHAEQRLQLSISDTGRGMTPEVQRRIFEPFFTTRANGTGLGLSIVRRIIEGHLGEMEVRSAEGRGTTFTLRLPCLTPAYEHSAAL